MSTYAVDAQAQQLRATGVIEAAPVWEESGGSRRPVPGAQARDESGVPLWQVEVMYQSEAWGRVASSTALVTVPAHTEPVLPAFEVIPFEGLSVNVYAPRGGGALRESWTAQGIQTTVSGRKSSTSSAAEAAA